MDTTIQLWNNWGLVVISYISMPKVFDGGNSPLVFMSILALNFQSIYPFMDVTKRVWQVLEKEAITPFFYVFLNNWVVFKLVDGFLLDGKIVYRFVSLFFRCMLPAYSLEPKPNSCFAWFGGLSDDLRFINKRLRTHFKSQFEEKGRLTSWEVRAAATSKAWRDLDRSSFPGGIIIRF